MASKEDQPKDSNSKIMKISDLPIYEKPEVKVKLIPEEIGPFRQQVSAVRQTLCGWVKSNEETIDSVKNKYETGKAHSQSTVEFLQSEGHVKKINFIGASGAITFLACYGLRRRALVTTALTVSAVTAATTLCYPNQTVDIVSNKYEEVKEFIKSKTG